MRYGASGARMLLFILMLLSSVAEAVPEPPVQPDVDLGFEDQSTTSGGYLTGRLVEDEAYFGHGAITNMATCLAVADDLEAARLWRGGLKDRPEADHALAAWLEDGVNRAADEPGFGTLVACAQIVAAWHTTLPDRHAGPAVDDGRVEHGAVVIDLATADGTRSPIRPSLWSGCSVRMACCRPTPSAVLWSGTRGLTARCCSTTFI